MDALPTWLIAVGVFVVYAHVVEYGTHRWVMHRRRRGWLRGEYQAHAVEHHAKNRLDFGVDASPIVMFCLCWPLLVGVVWLGWPWIAFVAVATWAYAIAWSAIHRSTHNLECPAIARSPIWNYWRRHHEQHHRHPNTNFGTLFPWTDHVFGTKARSA